MIMAVGSGQDTGTRRDLTVRAAVLTPLPDLYRRRSEVTGGQIFIHPNGELCKPPQENQEAASNGTIHCPHNAYDGHRDASGGTAWGDHGKRDGDGPITTSLRIASLISNAGTSRVSIGGPLFLGLPQ